MSSEKKPEQRNQEQLTTEMGLIIHGGNAKSLFFEAIYAAKKGDFEQAYQKLKEADEELLNAHQTQTQMLTQEAAGHPIEVHLLTIHSQDHLMNALTFRELAEEMVELHKELALIKAQL
ncbi:PTS lactose/cellobiose transporter subunit IIA [Enterococcus cecorum]|nr:PTS lactose/cellobiose transporter subunit IIA [Enterococcus cecorum]CAI3346832.1 PTS lactose/cellobiose transporter subunit IIA [Enterococcus cecorum]CAI3395969.1 PTS lactose/cellobiose transporter subunit IIA [Enterococcus cecorum]CAI3433714.1 PTS lactose/cellobiose transporter subunit IIA [Enterococcus cecorum]CAI3448339.1 PTS lactose/cellobiose transporter subunit IIA [Enterococcus cecorum]